jgi:hypothetical protein
MGKVLRTNLHRLRALSLLIRKAPTHKPWHPIQARYRWGSRIIIVHLVLLVHVPVELYSDSH